MKCYVAQKADQALEAMCGRGSLTKRLKTAQMHFIFVSDEHHLGTAPEHVRKSITAFLKCKTGRGSRRSAALAAEAIASTLIEFGRSDALLSLSLKQKGKRGLTKRALQATAAAPVSCD
jgi:hypothetical protein